MENELKNHEILSKDEEQKLARTFQQAKKLREKLHTMIDERIEAIEMKELQKSEDDEDDFLDSGDYATQEFPWASLSDQLLEMHQQRSLADELKFEDIAAYPSETDSSPFLDRGNFRDTSDTSSLSYISSAMGILEDEEIETKLKMTKREAYVILQHGAEARDRLIRSNYKLVVSIAQSWSDKFASHKVFGRKRYHQTWNRPGLSETLQEGSIGLASAVERFNPQKGMRLSTYATFWITNSIRRCYQFSSTPLMKLPIFFYDTKQRYMARVRDHIKSTGSVPELHVVAKQLDMSESRLQGILEKTDAMYQLDQFGGDVGARIIDPLEDPFRQVELSLVRQSLESAMAGALSPHERDVIRLRLGLDDGVSKSLRQVAEEMGDSVTLSNIRTTEKRALKKLRSPSTLETYKLQTFADFDGVGVFTDSKTSPLH